MKRRGTHRGGSANTETKMEERTDKQMTRSPSMSFAMRTIYPTSYPRTFIFFSDVYEEQHRSAEQYEPQHGRRFEQLTQAS